VAATDVFRDAWRAAHGTLRRLKAVLPYAQGQSPQRPKLHRLARLFRAGLGTPPADFHAALEAQREALEKLVREGEELLTFLDTNRNAPAGSRAERPQPQALCVSVESCDREPRFGRDLLPCSALGRSLPLGGHPRRRAGPGLRRAVSLGGCGTVLLPLAPRTGVAAVLPRRPTAVLSDRTFPHAARMTRGSRSPHLPSRRCRQCRC
jgi:hypothetical protein